MGVIDIYSNEELSNTSDTVVHPLYNGNVNLHFGKVGNVKLANFILNEVIELIADNPEMYENPIG